MSASSMVRALIPSTAFRRVSASLAVLTLLWAIFAQAAGSAVRTSLTVDEGLHITSGTTILRTGDFRLVEEHPPLVKAWLALPLLAVSDLPDPRTLPAWAEAATPTTESLPLLEMTRQFLYPYRPLDRLVVPARVMSALLAVLLGAVVFRWAKDIAGTAGGLLALFLLAFDPNILAHAGVAGTDLGAACFITLALFTLSRFLRRPTAPRLLLAGITLGLALGAKLSALLLLPVEGMLVLVCLTPHVSRLTFHASRFTPHATRNTQHPIGRCALLFLFAALTLWALYGFEVGTVPGVPFPVPAASHLIPWLRLREHMAGGHAAFLLGQNSTHGWWTYFPVAFALKTPLPTLVLLVACCVSRIAYRSHNLQPPTSNLQSSTSNLQPWLPLLLFPLLYAVTSLFSTIDIGYRHLLPVLPFLFIAVSPIANRVSPIVYCRSRIKNGPRNTQHATRDTRSAIRNLRYAILCALLLWLLIGTVRMFPHYLAYFNELAGGPDGGYRYLADSNTDWGQGYRDLARFQREQGLGAVRLSAFIFYDPAIYGVAYEPLTPLGGDTPAVFPARFDPPPGDYVISATTLDGIPLADPEMYDGFRHREPDARIAHVLFYYHVLPRDPPAAWLAQCTVPVAPLPPAAVAEGFGRDDLRLAYFDCSHAWLYPDGGRSPGWYGLYRGDETAGDFAQARLSLARLAYEQREPRDVPPFSLYEWSPAATERLWEGVERGAVTVAPSPWPPAQAGREGVSLAAPVPLAGPLTFRGYRLSVERAAPGETLELWTYWSVTSRPDRPLSLLAHLLDGEGRLLTAADGLGVPVEIWQADDLIVQRHELTVPPDAAPGVYWVQTGAYTLPDLQRLAVEGGPEGSDRLLLARVEVVESADR